MTPADQFGGADVMKTLLDKCVRDGEIRFDVDVHYYKMCDKKFECVRD